MADRPPGPSGRSFTLWVISAIFVAALLVAAIVVVVINQQPDQTAPPPPSSTAATTSPATTAPSSTTRPSPSADSTGCTLASQVSDKVPQQTPPEIEWRSTNYGALVPYSASAGPAIEDGPIADCYAHTPTGALLALSQIWARVGLNPLAEERLQVLDKQIVPSPERTQLREMLSSQASPSWHWRAFRFTSYSEGKAAITAVFEYPEQNVMLSSTFFLVWTNNTWRIDLSDSPLTDPPVVTADELEAYIPWSGRD